ncbi:MAG TPA: methyltransferase domain-containing protein [Mycobacteriales bacterium]|nr:methyltransferase domain-containing protein [Mycobacteriales bacterium]
MTAPWLSHWGRVRGAVVWQVLTTALAGLASPAHVLDAGGGTGGLAVPLALLGHRVTVVDPSPDSLAALERRSVEAAPGGSLALTAVQGDLTTLPDVVEPGSVDLVLCHSVLEVVDDPAAGLAAVAATLRAGGLASVLVANRSAAVLSRALSGHFTEAAAALDDADGRWGPADAARRRFGRDDLLDLVAAAGLRADEVHGVRVFSDLVPGALVDADVAAVDDLVALELAASRRPPYADLATQLHVLASRVTTSQVTP